MRIGRRGSEWSGRSAPSNPVSLGSCRTMDHTWSMQISDVATVTVTIPHALLVDMDRREKNRSKFVAGAVKRELERLRREEFLASLDNPHPESLALADQGLDDWAASLPVEDGESLLEVTAGSAVHWVPGEGWRIG